MSLELVSQPCLANFCSVFWLSHSLIILSWGNLLNKLLKHKFSPQGLHLRNLPETVGATRSPRMLTLKMGFWMQLTHQQDENGNPIPGGWWHPAFSVCVRNSAYLYFIIEAQGTNSCMGRVPRPGLRLGLIGGRGKRGFQLAWGGTVGGCLAAGGWLWRLAVGVH